MRRLIWGFAGRTYNIFGNLMLRLKFYMVIQKTFLWSLVKTGPLVKENQIADIDWFQKLTFEYFVIMWAKIDLHRKIYNYCRANQEWQWRNIFFTIV